MDDAYAPSPALNETEVIETYLYLKTTGAFALALTGLLAIGFLIEITRFLCWHRSLFLRLLLSFTKSPLVHWIGQFHAFVIAVPYYNELYLVWAVLLLTGFSSFHSITECSIYTNNKKKLMLFNEKILLLNSLGVLSLLLYYTLWYTKFGARVYNIYEVDFKSEAPAPSDSDLLAGRGHFAIILWLIWGFSLTKILYQITRYYYTDPSYESIDTKWVSLYMKRQQNVQNFDPKKMTGYRYLLAEDKPSTVGPAPNYEITIEDKDLVTIEDVWQSKGWLLNSGGGLGNKLKEACLSFALFKMLKRRFVEECETAEANRPETQDFIRQGLLEFSPGKVFRVINMELRFLRDLFYTKHPTVVKWGFLIYTLFFGILFTSLFGILFQLNHYTPPEYDLNNTHSGHNRDVVVTKVILFTVMVIVGWEFSHYFFSNWSKVLLVCNYMKYQKFLDHLPINMVLWVFGSIYIPGQITYGIGQCSLLQCYKISHCNCRYRATFGCLSYTDKVRKVKYVSLNRVKIMEAILPYLKQFLDTGLNHPGTITALSRRGIKELPSWVCELQNPIQTVMIWHVATNFCWMITKKEKQQTKEKPMAVILSNYCAYLVLYAPELLPINTYVSKLISDRIIQETVDFFQSIRKGKMVEAMEDVQDNEETVIARGARLGKMLKNEIQVDEYLWEFLKEVWVELMLRLAPSESSIAHATKLAEGGEFMTYLWVLLYHAGLLNQSSFKDGTTSMV